MAAVGAPDCALDEEMVTMRPQPPACMSGITDWVELKVPVRLTPITRFHSSAVMSVNGVWASMPALVTRISTAPNFSRTCPTALSTLVRSATSTCRPIASPPVATIEAATVSAPVVLKSRTATRCPAAPSCSAIAAPMPEPPPVTTATRLLLLLMIIRFRWG